MTKLKMSLLVAALSAGQWLVAQSVEEGKKFLYYERFKSAKETLQAVVSSKPNDAEANYWLGQALIASKDIAGAKAVYQKALQTPDNGSNPWLLVGMGHVELLEGKDNEARQRFETAISLTKGKDGDLLNAVGRAAADPLVKAKADFAAKTADGKYAVEKLQQATQIKKYSNPDVFLNMGDAYRKLLDGGGAVQSYQNALNLDPKNAAALYKIGKVYLTQGREQANLYVDYFNKAVEADPNYAPAFYELYYHYYNLDVNKAREYFAKYKAVTDQTPALEYEEASLLYASRDFKGAIAKADQLLTRNDADARLYRLKAYSYDRLGDSTNALKFFEQFFSKAQDDQILPDNYKKMAEVSAQFPEKAGQADMYFTKAIETDTLLKNKMDIAEAAVNMYKKAGNQAKVAEWSINKLKIDPNYGKTDLYYAGFESFRANNFPTADSLFVIYQQKWPNETFGWYWGARSKWAIDSTMEKGLANNDFKAMIPIAEQDKARNKNTLMIAYGYLAGYYANVAKEKDSAIVYLEKILAVDPNNEAAKANIDILKNSGNKGGAGKPASQPKAPMKQP